MQTPAAIVPEWYLLPFYAILRSIPNKLLGVIAMFSAILILLTLSFTDVSRSRGMQFRPLSKVAFYIFIANFLILMQLGAKHVESPFIEFGQISTILYFTFFLVIIIVVTSIENTIINLSLKNSMKKIIKSKVIENKTHMIGIISHKSSSSSRSYSTTCTSKKNTVWHVWTLINKGTNSYVFIPITWDDNNRCFIKDPFATIDCTYCNNYNKDDESTDIELAIEYVTKFFIPRICSCDQDSLTFKINNPTSTINPCEIKMWFLLDKEKKNERYVSIIWNDEEECFENNFNNEVIYKNSDSISDKDTNNKLAKQVAIKFLFSNEICTCSDTYDKLNES